jgi:stress response protein YsnF
MIRNFHQIQAGWNVYGSDDGKVGDVAEVASNYILVQKGWLFPRDIYVPFSAIASVEDDSIYLFVTKDQVTSMDWDTIPTEDVTTGYSTMSDVADQTVVSTTADHDYSASTIARDGTSTPSFRTTGSTDASNPADTYLTAGDEDLRDRTTEEFRIPVIEEDIRIGKRAIESGGIQVTQHVEERPVNEQVTLRDETVHVERRAVDRPVSDADLAAVRGGVIEAREYHEEAVIEKQARIVEEVVVNKDVDERIERVQDTVHRTDVQVEELPGNSRTSQFVETKRVSAGDRTRARTVGGTYATDVESSVSDEGAIERGMSRAGNAVERATGVDLDRDQDVGVRDPRNNI